MSKLLNETIKELKAALAEAEKLKLEKRNANQRIKVADVIPIISKVRETEKKQSTRIEELTNHGSEEDEDEDDDVQEESEKPTTVAATPRVHNDYHEEDDGPEDADDDGSDAEEEREMREDTNERPKKRPKRAVTATDTSSSDSNNNYNPFKEQIKNKKKDMVNKRAFVDGKITKNPSSVLKRPNSYFTNNGAPQDIETAPDNVILTKKKKMQFYDKVEADETALEQNPEVALLTKKSFNVVETIFAIVEKHITKDDTFGMIKESLTRLTGELKNKNAYIPLVKRIVTLFDERASIVHEMTRPSGLELAIHAAFTAKPSNTKMVVQRLKGLSEKYPDDGTLEICINVAAALEIGK